MIRSFLRYPSVQSAVFLREKRILQDDGVPKGKKKDVPTEDILPEKARLSPAPYYKVGNIIIVELRTHLWQQGWELARDLRWLRFEYRGQVTAHPDIPEVRERLFHVRHLVTLDMISLDELKNLLRVPPHIHFSDLSAQYPATWGEVSFSWGCYGAARKLFSQYRRDRLRDIIHRDTIEKRLVAVQKQLKFMSTLTAKTNEAEKNP